MAGKGYRMRRRSASAEERRRFGCPGEIRRTKLHVRQLLILAHPGHELRAFGWMMRNRRVWILTDGSGRSSETSHQKTTRRLLHEHGASTGGWFGSLSDLAFYDLVRRGDPAPLVDATRQLASRIASSRAETVVGDALEGAIMAHDVCRHLINAAVELASKETGTAIVNLDVILEGAPRLRADSARRVERIELSDAEFAGKRAAAQAYDDVRVFVEEAIRRFGESAFRHEVFCEVDPRAGLEAMPEEPPIYRQHGESLVERGIILWSFAIASTLVPFVARLREAVRLAPVPATP